MGSLAKLDPRFLEITLKQIALPATHNSGMNRDITLSGELNCQSMTIEEQLAMGIRTFDLRPRYDSDEMLFEIYHRNTIDFWWTSWTCPGGETFPALLDGIKKFMTSDGQTETVILFISHVEFEDDPLYTQFVQEIITYLDVFLYKASDDTRIADVPLKKLSGKVVVLLNQQVLDPVKSAFKAEGIYTYAYNEKDSEVVDCGDVITFDHYADSSVFREMANDQLAKFSNFDGVNSELFYLSWTMTPTTYDIVESIFYGGDVVMDFAEESNSGLYNKVSKAVPNSFKRIPNFITLDYFEDKALLLKLCIEITLKKLNNIK